MLKPSTRLRIVLLMVLAGAAGIVCSPLYPGVIVPCPQINPLLVAKVGCEQAIWMGTYASKVTVSVGISVVIASVILLVCMIPLKRTART
ncbi:MAG: hypothetical protein UV00_C0036G0008 [candidate division WWE3 bacterium GW2011_GWF1_42_14]|uniref:Uncharacterized protein n=1 Tax=candidate division WWE3 bacterium GW2011_GWF1_42_14 TaxID=1619138 RepID=A0A0G0YFJ2_UNCKA|nr:MAG: hypothetical protein UV00_C0036G0008 [candidate division WWE3 bacterium GW2011_GWF1_42_14]